MQSLVIKQNGCPVTTSLAIADGIGNTHKTVIQLIRQNTVDLEDFGRVAFEMRSFETKGGSQNREVAILNEQQATLLLTYMRNNETVKAFKKRLVKAFFEMRDQLHASAPNINQLSKMDILKLAMESEEQRLKLEQTNKQLSQKVEQDAPKVQFAERVYISPDAISVGEAAKIIGTGQRRLFDFLRNIGWISRRNEPYQQKIEQGLLNVKLSNFQHPEHGLKQSVTTVVTGKGLTKLKQLWDEEHPQLH
ncbi:Phage antirepressor protein KilAC domain protein [Marinomonas spartinae]|uniref:Phage antirepressor protein KilAC domain protein n=1 Tax=Marinomonas spartinae TaxID=1792290 RepID=A0A1A8T8U8_9GAMM|nr:phage regulatory protein/antirepressor Ant [Marinomonas spartinae]SBS29112.1 Phage antirepressor protein KilAC domain protein [Marinomonas spartinae]